MSARRKIVSLTCILSILTSDFAFPAVIDNSSESKFAGNSVTTSLLTAHEKTMLCDNDLPVGYDTYVFPHELFIGTIVAGLTAYWSYKRLTRKRPLF